MDRTMNELELLEQLQTIKHKLDNNEKLTDPEFKLFSTILFGIALGIMKHTTEQVLNIIEGSEIK